MKIVSWNVNGIRAIIRKGFLDIFYDLDTDIFCIQETKCQIGQVEIDLPGYYQYWNEAMKKGYAGTAIFSKEKAMSVSFGLGIEEHDQEGRIITLEFNDYYVVNCYTPYSKRDHSRLDYRMKWQDDVLAHLLKLETKKPVILCGDLNVAHNELDLKNHKTNHKNPGFTDQERNKMTELLESGFTDSLRYFYPDTEGLYSWWPYRNNARERNVGWRVDYIITSKKLDQYLSAAGIYKEITGSDHCPIYTVIE